MKYDKSMIDVAEECLKEATSSLLFKDLYDEVALILEMTDEEKDAHIGHFYTDLTLDGRFIPLNADNYWDLRSRHIFDKAHFDTKSATKQDEVEEEQAQDSIDKKENLEYDAAMKGEVATSGEEGDDSSLSGEDEDSPNLV